MTRFRATTIAFFSVTGLVVLAGILTAWGWTNVDALLVSGPRLGVVITTAIVFVAAMFYVPPNALSTGRIDAHVRRQMIMPVFAGIAMTAVLLVSPFTDQRQTLGIPGGETLRWFGLSLHVVGAWFSAWGPVHLGREFSIFATIQDDHRLVTDGPFAIVRHPRYFGFAAWAVGAALSFASILGLLFALAIVGLMIWRLLDEERVLRAEFGDAWLAYRKRTPALVPSWRSRWP